MLWEYCKSLKIITIKLLLTLRGNKCMCEREEVGTVKADLLQVGRSQSALFLREQWERLKEQGIE